MMTVHPGVHVRAWVEDREAGVYRNLETGLERRYERAPARGKWKLVRPRRTMLKVIGNNIYWEKAGDASGG